MAKTKELLTTALLLQRIRSGDANAREQLFKTYLPIMRRWAHGRLPPHSRDLAETADIVQITLLRALNRLDDFESRHEGAFLAYLRTIMLNTVLEEIRRSSRRGHRADYNDEVSPGDMTPLSIEELESYEQALGHLGGDAREAAILRLEFGMSWSEIASAMRQPSANAVRMMTVRALTRLADEMK